MNEISFSRAPGGGPSDFNRNISNRNLRRSKRRCSKLFGRIQCGEIKGIELTTTGVFIIGKIGNFPLLGA